MDEVMGCEFFVIMLKRTDRKIYADLHKTNQRIYLSRSHANDALEAMGSNGKHYHVIKMVAALSESE